MSTGLAITVAPTAFADGAPTTTVTHLVTGDDGRLEVDLSDSAPLTSLQISVRSSTADDAATLLTVSDFSNDTTTAPVQLPAGTAYGSYPVDVDYTLADGTTQHWSGAAHGTDGLLNYRKHAFLAAFTTDRTSTDFTHRDVVLSGHVDAFDPATGTTGPAGADTDVALMWQEDHSPYDSYVQRHAEVDTDENGDFQLLVTPGGGLENGAAVIHTTPADLTPAGTSQFISNVPANPVTYRVTSSPSATQVHKGTRITVRGKVEQLVGGKWKPFGGAPVVTTAADPDSYQYTVPHQLASTTSAADGSFSYPITANMTTLLHTYLRPSTYLPPNSQDEDTVNVPTAGSITLPAWSIDDEGLVKTTGRLNGNASNQSLWLQYSPNGKSGWINLSHITTGYTYGKYVSYAMQAYGNYDGYYRVIHFESAQMLGLVQPAHRLNRIRTQMSVTVTPTRPSYDTSKLSVSGVVTQMTSKGWAHYNHAYVVLVYKPKGDTEWYWVKKAYTNAAGRYSFSTPAYGDGTWGAYLQTDSKHFYSSTKGVNVDVIH
ncbi:MULTISPECIES: hypothetical protein [unclassified Streptomyces]|uniref:hypothetical protein n=1 Tax=unclassified Streptomyces TaxID=2593676 RepID=UPI00114CD13E|nr:MULTISPECIES: hypothetical protein [unclassified Streptomyces]MYS23903.1 hypothetical protein [Streptomyces sp. SID4948]